MSVKIGHASISEKGTIRGTAGDQNGKEVFTRKWYKHSKGWITLRCKVPEMREHIARAMEKACANPDIGYDQIENQSLWNDVKLYGYDPSKTTRPVETDCARLVRVCVQYACEMVGNGVQIPDFYTANLANVLVKTGLFEKLTASKYNDQDDFLIRSDIQVTKTKGHTWIILENGSEAEETKPGETELGSRTLKKGMEGNDVRRLQQIMLELGYELPRYGADGDFGSETHAALLKLQTVLGVPADGVYDDADHAALLAFLKKGSEKQVRVTAAKSAYVRTGPGTDYAAITTVGRGEVFSLVSAAENGWRCIEINGGQGWISPKMSEEI